MKLYQTYRCNKCGNEVEVSKVGSGELVCCGEKMECITKNLTEVNLMKAFAGESMARNKYELYGDLAKEAGLMVLANEYYLKANQEKTHARLELSAFKKLKNIDLNDIKNNLLDAIAGEEYETLSMYPEFSQIAKEEGLNDISVMFNGIGKVEEYHKLAYEKLLNTYEKDEFFQSDEEVMWMCMHCGHIHKGKKAPKACAVCKKDSSYFIKYNLLQD